MRTTITLDDDVAAKLSDTVRKRGISFKDAVNSVLRTGFAAAERPVPRRRFRVKVFDTGPVAPGIDLDRLDETLDMIEGPFRR